MVNVSKETEEWIIKTLNENIMHFHLKIQSAKTEKRKQRLTDLKTSNQRILNLFTSRQNKTLYIQKLYIQKNNGK